MEKRLCLSSTDKKLAGVCGGIAEYFGIDSTLVRIGYLALVIFAGTGLLLYIICAFPYSNHVSFSISLNYTRLNTTTFLVPLTKNLSYYNKLGIIII